MLFIHRTTKSQVDEKNNYLKKKKPRNRIIINIIIIILNYNRIFLLVAKNFALQKLIFYFNI